jgi:hypothetical protein
MFRCWEGVLLLPRLKIQNAMWIEFVFRNFNSMCYLCLANLMFLAVVPCKEIATARQTV